MADNPCPGGSRLRAGVDATFRIDEAFLTSLAIAELPVFSLVGRFLLGMYIDLYSLCTGERPAYPDLSNIMNVGLGNATDLLLQWVKAWLWDQYAECIPVEEACTNSFDPDHGLKVTHNIDDATMSHENVPGQQSVTAVFGGYVQGTNLLSVTKNVLLQNGDILVVFVGTDWTPSVTPPAGWTTIAHLTGSYHTIAGFYRIMQPGDTGPWSFTSTGAGMWCYHMAIRGVDQDNPIADYSAETDTDTGHIEVDPLDHTSDTNRQVTMAFTRGYPHPCYYPPGAGATTEFSGVNYTAVGQLWEVTAASPTPQRQYTTYPANRMAAIGVIFNAAGAPASEGHVFSWEANDGRYRIWAVPDTETEGEFYSGSAGEGYKVQYRFPAHAGGTLPGNDERWNIYDYDNHARAVIETAYAGDMIWYEHPCVPWRAPGELPPPSGDPVLPFDPTADTLAAIAAAIDMLEYKLDGIGRMLFELNASLMPWTGVYSGIFGQNQTIVSGIFPDVVVSALEAMSRYDPTERFTLLEETGITGDWESPHEGHAWLVTITALPEGIGSRGGTLRCYEVNSRADQLGWYTLREGNHYLDWQVLVFGATIVKAPDKYPRKLHLYLRPGVQATVHRVTYAN